MDDFGSGSQPTLIQDTFPISKAIFGLILAAVVPVFALFLIVLLVFGLYLVYSFLFESQELRVSELLDTIGVLFGVACFVSAYAIPPAIPCVAVFGFPAVLIGWRLRLIRWWTCVAGGFFLGSIPGALLLWSSYSSGSSAANGVQYWINGNPTAAGIIQYMALVVLIGFLGAIGGGSFWLVWRNFPRPTKQDQSNF